MTQQETYLGDGLYARFDGYAIWLRAPRIGGDHEVALEPGVLQAFDEYRAALQRSDRPQDDQGEAEGGR